MCQALSTKGEVTSGNEDVSSGFMKLQVFILTGKPSFPQYFVSSVAHLTYVANRTFSGLEWVTLRNTGDAHIHFKMVTVAVFYFSMRIFHVTYAGKSLKPHRHLACFK